MSQFLLEGRALDLAKDIDSIYDSLKRKQILIEEQSKKEWEQFQGRQNEQIQSKMDELGDLLGLDKNDGQIHLDGTYLEELGLMFLVQEPREENNENSLAESIAAAISESIGKYR